MPPPLGFAPAQHDRTLLSWNPPLSPTAVRLMLPLNSPTPSCWGFARAFVKKPFTGHGKMAIKNLDIFKSWDGNPPITQFLHFRGSDWPFW